METRKTARPQQWVMWFITGVLIVLVGLFYINFSNNWTNKSLFITAIFFLMATGMLVATLYPKKGWWGLRLNAFIIFASYVGYVIYEFTNRVDTGSVHEINPSSGPTAFEALLGFLFIGVPCLFYALSGHVMGKLGHQNPTHITLWDVGMYYTAKAIQWLFFALILWQVMAALLKFL